MNLNSIDEVIKSFDVLPETAVLRIPVVIRLIGISRSTFYRKVSAGDLKTYKISERAVGVKVGELRKYMQSIFQK